MPAPVGLGAWPGTDAAREVVEAMLVTPQGTYTVSNTFPTNQSGEVGLAFGGTPLMQPTDVADAGSPQALNITNQNAARGVVLTPHGADLIGRCPFHDDHEPSLVITPAKNLWHCLGACQRGGSVIDWVMQAEG